MPRRRRAKVEDFLALEIPDIPPLSEQKRIAAILDKADELPTKRTEAIAELDKLQQSVFLDMFGDPITNSKGWDVGVVGDCLESAAYGSSQKASVEPKAFPILRMGNITYGGEIDISELKYVDLEPKDQEKYLVTEGQILFNRTNSKDLVGKTAVFKLETPMAFAGYLVRGIPNHRCEAEYLSAFMNTPQLKQFLKNKCKAIVGMANINATEFQAIPIPIPPRSIQEDFRKFVDLCDSMKQRNRSHLIELNGLFGALQSKAFKGEL